jgi:hypothetical protein
MADGGGPVLPPFALEEEARKYDWVQLDSGEWLKGEIKQMYDGKLYFDSDEFGDVSADWSDVASLIPSGPVRLRLPNRRVVVGDFEMHDKVITVDTGAGIVHTTSAEVTGLEVGEQTELNYWSAGASVGLAARAGNNKQFDLSLRANVKRQTTLTRGTVSYTGAISSAQGQSTDNNHRVPAALDFFVTDRFFVTAPSFEFYTDKFQNIDARFTVGAGVGYDLYSNGWADIEVAGGMAYQNTSFISVIPPNSKTANDAAATFRINIDFDLPRGIEWDNLYALQLTVTDFDKTSHHMESVLSFDIWGPLELEASFIFDRIEKPVETAPGIRPNSNDYRLTLGLAIDL